METTLLTGVPETMLITLWAKATETQQNGGLIEDNDAVRMMKQIDYDFSKFKKAKMSQAGSCVRASLTQWLFSLAPESMHAISELGRRKLNIGTTSTYRKQ